MSYPSVHDELTTIMRLCAGKSIARFGDGELKLMCGHGYSREPANTALTSELFNTFTGPSGQCLIGIPTMSKLGPKYVSWTRHRDRFATKIASSSVSEFYSAFITRPDSAPWIKTEMYAQQIERLWLGKRAAVVCEAEGSMIHTVRLRAKKTEHIVCSRVNAYKDINELCERVYDARVDVAILSAGPTATCMANRLAHEGVHAVDLGSAGGWLWNLLK